MTSTIEKTLDTKVGKITLLDAGLIGVSKLASEQALSMIPQIGNGTLKSGMIKTASAVAVSMASKNRKALQIVTTGVLIDGMEDLVLAGKRYIKAKWGMGNESQSSGLNEAFA